MNALYNGSLRIKISYFYPEESKVYKWCGTKVAHCTSSNSNISNVFRKGILTYTQNQRKLDKEFYIHYMEILV